MAAECECGQHADECVDHCLTQLEMSKCACFSTRLTESQKRNWKAEVERDTRGLPFIVCSIALF